MGIEQKLFLFLYHDVCGITQQFIKLGDNSNTTHENLSTDSAM